METDNKIISGRERKKNIIFWVVFISIIIVAVALTYVRVFINKDYLVVDEVSCDPATEDCFVYTAEDLCAESEVENCTEETRDEYYKIIYKKAANVPFCEYDPELGESCPELTCEVGESEEECYYEMCEEDCG
jgi:hypothetical protein